MMTQTTPRAVNTNQMAAEAFLEGLERYQGSVYAARVSSTLALVKRGREEVLEGLNLVAVPILTAQALERAGYVPGIERKLWDVYRELFGPQAAQSPLSGVFDPGAIEAKGGIQVHPDYLVYQYPCTAHLNIGGTRIPVHGEHCVISDHQRHHYEEYKETTPAIQNANITRKLSDDELMRDAKYQAEHKPRQFFSITTEARQELREWYESAPYGADYDRLDELEQRQIRYFVLAKDIRTRLERIEKRLTQMRPAQQKAAWADVWELRQQAVDAYNQGLTCMNLKAYLEELMAEREKGWFEAQIEEWGGMFRDMCSEAVHHAIFQDRDDTSYSERLQYDTDLHIKMQAA